jgi:hypothetical protein
MMREIARTAGFVLFEYSSADGWRNLKLARSPQVRGIKSNWWLGWNGERLSRKRDARVLEEDEPEVFSWLVTVLTQP